MVNHSEEGQKEQEQRQERKGRPGRGSFGLEGVNRELARRAGKASGAKRQEGVRERAESAFGRVLGLMVTELVRLWGQREGFREKRAGVVELTEDEEFRLWWLAERIITHTKGVIPISATVDSRVDIPIIPAGVIELLRGIVPGREALELGEVVEAQVRSLPDEPRPLAPGQSESKQHRRERNRWEWRQKHEADRRARQQRKARRQQGDTPAPPPNDAPAPPTVPLPATQPDPADPAPPTRPAPEVGDP